MSAYSGYRPTGGGRHALTLISRHFSLDLLGHLAAGDPASASELDRMLPSVGRTTLDDYIGLLESGGALIRRRRPASGATIDLRLTAYGRAVAGLSVSVRDWLGENPKLSPPDAPTEAGPAIRAVSSFAEGWGGAILAQICRTPMTRNGLMLELLRDSGSESGGLASVDQVARRLRWMTSTGMVAAVDRSGLAPLYGPTEWSAAAARPLAEAIAIELAHRPPLMRPPLPAEVDFVLDLAAASLKAEEHPPASVVVRVTESGWGPSQLWLSSPDAASDQPPRGRSPGGEGEGEREGEGVSADVEIEIGMSALFDSVIQGDLPEVEVRGDPEVARATLGSVWSRLVPGAHSAG